MYALDCHLHQLYLLRIAALRIILKIQPLGHVTTYFKELQIMPIDMLFKYRFLIQFHKANFTYELDIERPPPQTYAGSNDIYQPKRITTWRGSGHCLPLKLTSACIPRRRGGNSAVFSSGKVGVCSVCPKVRVTGMP